jgi:hypothetical protein
MNLKKLNLSKPFSKNIQNFSSAISIFSKYIPSFELCLFANI